ncbi:GlxA family transcriptional regulator [Modestobacter altitudinis]|uniref:GlxA family transcriptional regulator n=1 Tax=Modestobacter altitudinis TaxID=2213158 RepID=UPI001C54FF88|nr:DJ-1/PfpI family protein [Modestobacter altitudinis]
MQRTVVVVGYDGAELLDLACVTTTLAMANAVGEPAEPYALTVVSPGGRPIQSATGLVLGSQAALERTTGPIDTLVVSGGVTHADVAADPALVAHVRRLARESRRVASVCTGASVLAAAGLLDGRRATTHWQHAAQLAERYPHVDVDPGPIFIRDGHVTTAAGITSALDLALAFVQEDHGVDLARMVSRILVTYLQRPGNQAQMSVFTAAPPPEHDVVRRVVDHVLADLAADLGTTALAAVAGVTPRHLTRLFTEHLGQPPGRYVRQARTAAAAQLLETTSLPLPRIAARCGLGTAENLRQAFAERYGVAPSAYRAAHGLDRASARVPD